MSMLLASSAIGKRCCTVNSIIMVYQLSDLKSYTDGVIELKALKSQEFI